MTFLRKNARSLLLSFLVLVFCACGDGGCSGCEGCGVAPIPGGYPIEDRIENSAQVRLTSSGVDFIEENIDGIITTVLPEGLNFDIPRSEGSASGFDYTVCPDSDCVAHGEIHEFTLTPVAPNRLSAHIRIVVDSRDAAGGRRPLPVRIDPPLLPASTCRVDLDTREGSRPYAGLVADIDFVAETQPARAGYTKLVVQNADLADGEGIEDDDIDVGGCTGYAWLLNLLKGMLVDELQGQISDLLQGALDEQMCTKRGEYGCPTGTFARPDAADPESVCRYADSDDAECVPILLGTDGQGDLGAAFLGGFSPGTHAPGQFLLASGGDGEAVDEGMSLFFYGGWRGTDRSFTTSPAHNPCVPLVDPPPLPTIPRAGTFRGNTIPGGGEAHVGIGLSEQYLNYVGYGLFDSGMLCIGAGTRLSEQLSTGLFSILITSIKQVAFPTDPAPISLSLRPQEPPVFEIGAGTADEALLDVTLPNLEIDFYVWSSERYVRIMTYKADLTIPINLSVADGAIAPEIVEVRAENSSVSNSELLEEDPAELAVLIEDVISMFAGMLTGSIDPFELPELSGFLLEVPEGGIQGIEDSGDEFLGIFANLALAPSSGMLTGTANTSARLESLHVDPTVLRLETYGEGEIPWVRLELDADGPSGVDYEYSWRIDGMQWSRWSSDPFPIVQHRAFLLQARHEVEVRARIAGTPGTQDPSPARVEVLIDALAPEVEAARQDDGVRIRAWDVISPADALDYRYRKSGGEWSAWAALGESAFVPVGFDDTEVDVEVRDEAENVGAARAPLIRGLPNAAADEGCGCSVPGQDDASPLAALGLLAVFGVLFGRRRGQRRRSRGVSRSFLSLLVLFALPVALGVQGCSCSDDKKPVPCDGECAEPDPSATRGNLCCEAMNMCVNYDRDALCDPGYECPVSNLTLDDSCNISCSMCEAKPALVPGTMATHLDMVVTADGSIVFSGYSPGVPPMRRYGDLVVGSYDVSSMSTSWEIVDGAPSSPITNDPNGWRGGVSDPGDDVGRWTSIAEAGGNFYVAYYDVTNGALKMAIGTPGGSWAVHTVDDEGDSGRYASLVLDGAGSPVVSYLRMAGLGDGSGVVNGSVLVASAASANPAGPTDWTVTEINAVAMPCRPGLCASGEECLEDSGLCVTETADCAEDCASGDVCYMASCQTALPDNFVEDMPPANGMYTALARTSTGLAVVWYDRTAGNIMGASYDGTSWSAPVLIDGYGVGDPDVGDSGLGATLFVDSADVWHVAYVDGAEEAVRYARVEAGTVTTELVDDGSTDGTMRHPDGRHIVGDDASIAVTDGGQVRIAYQDATSQRLMLATRNSGDTEWTVTILDPAQHTGWWVEQALVGTTSYVATWWRGPAGDEIDNGVRVLTVE